MDRNFAEAFMLVLRHEGGWSEHPKDPGGATMKGVTLATFRRYVDPKATKDDLRKIADAQLQRVYREQYWNKVAGDDLPDGVDYAVFDFAVNSGPSRAAQFLQRVVDVTHDGQIGPKTLAAVRSLPANQIIENLCTDRIEFLRGLKTWKTFGKGWKSRVIGVRSVSLQMARSAAPASVTTAPDRASPPVLPSPPATSFAAPGWLSLVLSLFKRSAPGGLVRAEPKKAANTRESRIVNDT